MILLRRRHEILRLNITEIILSVMTELSNLLKGVCLLHLCVCICVSWSVSTAGPRPYKVCAGAFAPHCVTLPDLILTVSRLSASRAVGVDGIPITAIRSCLPAVGPLILHLVNSSISTLTFPDSWKVAIVTPIHKSGDQKLPGNFRPISILPALSKILEIVVCSQLTSYLITNHILSPSHTQKNVDPENPGIFTLP